MNRSTIRGLCVLAGTIGVLGAAQADLFTDFTGFTSLNGAAHFDSPNTLFLTDGVGGQSSSAYLTSAIDVSSSWTLSFRYTADSFGGFGPADGFTFVIQNAGTSALGGSGDGLGYAGMGGSSVAVAFNIWEFASSAGRGTEILQNGNVDHNYTHTNPVDLTLSSGVDVKLTYDSVNHTLREDLSQGANSFFDVFTSIDLGTTFGSSAYVGFTGADGAGRSRQRISFGEPTGGQPTPEPFTMSLGLAGAGLFIRRRIKSKKA